MSISHKDFYKHFYLFSLPSSFRVFGQKFESFFKLVCLAVELDFSVYFICRHLSLFNQVLAF